MTSNIERLGIQESVEAIFPPSELAGYLSDLPVEVTVVDEAGIADCDAVVTRNYFDALLEIDWIHSTQAGVDRFPLEALADAGSRSLTAPVSTAGRSVRTSRAICSRSPVGFTTRSRARRSGAGSARRGTRRSPCPEPLPASSGRERSAGASPTSWDRSVSG